MAKPSRSLLAAVANLALRAAGWAGGWGGSSSGRRVVVIGLGFGWATFELGAASIAVPNGSFESPATTFVDPRVDSWQKAPKPDWYDESGGFRWDQLTGVFLNTKPGSSDHIDNLDGNQGLFLFALPQVAIFQDYDSTNGTKATLTHAFDARFEVGQSYHLDFALLGGGGGMVEGASLRAAFYYRDNATNLLTVTAATITHRPTLFSNLTHLVEFHLDLPAVQPGDAWANKPIGVQFLSTVPSNLSGGYWDLDNVRLRAEGGAQFSSIVYSRAGVTLTLQGVAGQRYDILGAGEAAAALSRWAKLGTMTNVTGTAQFVDRENSLSQRFYQARQVQ